MRQPIPALLMASLFGGFAGCLRRFGIGREHEIASRNRAGTSQGLNYLEKKHFLGHAHATVYIANVNQGR